MDIFEHKAIKRMLLDVKPHCIVAHITEEIWKPVINYENIYEVSNYSRIKRLIGFGCKKERILKSQKGNGGHLFVTLCKNNKKKYFKVYRLSLEAFVGSCPNKMEVCHNDGNTENNFIENLRYGTLEDNQKDKILHGKIGSGAMGSKNINSKLLEYQVIEIKRLLKENKLTQIKIAKIYSVSQSIISLIASDKLWKHV